MLNPANYSTISFPLLGIEIDPIRYFNIGPLTVHLYGVVIAFGLLLAGVYCSRRSKRAGLTEDDIKPTYQSFSDSADALKNGQIDAAFIVAGAPTTAVTDLATTKDTYLVSLDSEHIAKLLETSDYYTETVIAKDVYFGD